MTINLKFLIQYQTFRLEITMKDGTAIKNTACAFGRNTLEPPRQSCSILLPGMQRI